MVIYTTVHPLRIVLLSQDPFDFTSYRLTWIVLKVLALLRMAPTYFDPTIFLGSYHFTVLSMHQDTHPLFEDYWTKTY
jgi:hypothetical protein